MKIGLLVGSLRKDSWNRKVAEVVKEIFPEEFQVDFIEIKDLPLYNPDLDEENPLEEYKRIRKDMREADAYIFFTPEYNRSYAPAIKNALDIVSRDKEANPLARKPVAVFSASMGATGGMAGNHALRQTFTFLDLIPLQQPEMYLGKIQDSFDENGKISERSLKFIQKAVDAFVDHVKLFQK